MCLASRVHRISKFNKLFGFTTETRSDTHSNVPGVQIVFSSRTRNIKSRKRTNKEITIITQNACQNVNN